MAAERIMSGGAEIICVAGGTESMSMIPMGKATKSRRTLSASSTTIPTRIFPWV